MPLLWRYLLKNYFQVFLLCVMGFIAVLLVTRVQEIARLVALNSEIGKIALFTLFQIPYILPIAIPISGLISAILLIRRLSYNHELTAFRAAGIPVKTLGTPLLMAAFLLSVVNFAIVSEVTPRCRHLSHHLIQSAATINPLFLMKKSKMLKLKDSYVDMKMTELGKEANNVIIAVKNESSGRLNLMLAKKLTVEDNLMSGEEVTLISHIPEERADLYDNLIIENQKEMSTSAMALSSLMKKKTYRLGVEHLPMKALLQTFSNQPVHPKIVKRARFELCRRIFFPAMTFAFTLLGFSVGLEIGRGKKKKGLYVALLFAALTFICSIAAKSFELETYKMMICYSLPFPILVFTSLWFQRRILGGIE
ncbi:LptF/LptG family permease [Candidatus Neptunochlamydia vexilliferae]|uniref:Permease YjgP/YjgQ family protein n=1 Tax=Candidatus Neptunichlamydia vexilliferae TaxID=1651774 RepID=A0ABS0B1T1_9BACT|nr:LptF/LptG family permease [Candidatus Neptunochlamydia vexilliferae]MBF5059515.1 hypothetical protein [Candidatus Neptunochlamydia vexilliferae]